MGEVNYRLFKFIVFIFNIILVLVGISLIVIGSLFLTTFKHDYHFAKFSVQAASIAFIVIGSVLLIFAVLGLLVIYIEGKPLVLVHLTGLLIAFIALATLGIWGFVITYNGDLEKTTWNEMWTRLNAYNGSINASAIEQDLDWLQRKFKCCGIRSYADWENNTSVYYYHRHVTQLLPPDVNRIKSRNESLYELPDSCCKKEDYRCAKFTPALSTLNTNGCFKSFFQYLVNDMNIICGIAVSLAFLTLIAIALLIYVCLSLKADYSPLTTYA